MKNLIDKLARRILALYKKYLKKHKHRGLVRNKEKQLSYLSPGVDSKILLEDYYVNKIANSIVIVGISLIIMVFSIFNRMNSHIISEDNTLARKNYGNGNYNVLLNAKSEEYNYGNIDLEVEERKLTRDEYKELLKETEDILAVRILAENSDFNHIDTDMDLPVALDGIPFKIRWESSDYMLLQTDGKFGDLSADAKGNDISLRAIIQYGELEYSKEYPLRIYPHRLTEEEKYHAELRAAIKEENIGRDSKDSMKLPESVNGTSIVWKEYKEPIILLILIILPITILAVWLGKDQDLKNKCEDRERQLLIEYSEFVSKLQLLLSSGLTIRGALERMAGDYAKYIKKGGKEKYVYEELTLCVKKLQDGLSEARSYEFFGSRCGLVNYKKLSSLLIQNLRKGNEGLIAALASEAEVAFEERKALAKRMGEEAQTKLLFPMIMMLGIVMIIIMVPAYMSFGGM